MPGALCAARVDSVAAQRLDLLQLCFDAEHRAGRQRLHQAPALRHQLQRSFQLEHASQTRRSELADAVAQQHVRLYAVVKQQIGQRVLDHKQRRLRDSRLREHALSFTRLAAVRGEQQLAQTQSDQRLEHSVATVEERTKARLTVVELPAHPDELRALTRETSGRPKACLQAACRG